MGNRELKIFSGQKGYVGTEKLRGGSSFDVSSGVGEERGMVI